MHRVFAYANATTFLKTEVDREIGQGTGGSLRRLSRKMGYRSPSMLSMILNGKRTLGALAAERFAEVVGMDDKAREYFLTLVRLAHCRTEADRLRLQEKVIRLRRAQKTPALELGEMSMLDYWYVPVIYELIPMRGFRWEASWINRRLRFSLTEREIFLAKSIITHLKLVQGAGKKVVRKKSTFVIEPSKLKSIAEGERVFRISLFREKALALHRQMVRLAYRSVDLSPELRDLQTLIVAMPRAKISVFKQRLEEFRREMGQLVTDEDPADSVYCLSMQFFPLTRS